MPSAEMAALFARIRTAVPAREFSVESHRDRARRGEALTVPDEGTEVEEVRIGDQPAEWVRAAGSARRRAVVFLHHGAFIAGSRTSLRVLGHRLALACGVDVLAPDYRLAPEHPFPAAVEDAVAAYRWVLERGFAPGRVALAGASAGGGIAAAAMIAVRDAGLPRPAAGLLLCPMADATLTSAAMVSTAQTEPVDSRDIVRQAVALYLAGVEPTHPWASPARADLAGLPPLHVEAAGADRLMDDARLLVERARAAGVRATLEVTEGAVHNFAQLAADIPESRHAIARMAAHLDRFLDS